MLKKENIIAEIENIVKRLLEKNGFVIDFGNNYKRYIKNYEWGYDYCFLPTVHFQPEHITFNLTMHRRIDFIERIWQEWSNFLNINIEDPNSITTLYITEKNAYPEIINKRYYDGFGAFIFKISEKDLISIEPVLKEIFEQKIISKMDELRDLKNIDKLINSDLDPPQTIGEIFNVDGGFMFRRMIVAKITDNSIYENICRLYKSRFENLEEIAKTPGKEYFLNYPIIFEMVYDKLKNIEPFKNTVLTVTDNVS